MSWFFRDSKPLLMMRRVFGQVLCTVNVAYVPHGPRPWGARWPSGVPGGPVLAGEGGMCFSLLTSLTAGVWGVCVGVWESWNHRTRHWTGQRGTGLPRAFTPLFLLAPGVPGGGAGRRDVCPPWRGQERGSPGDRGQPPTMDRRVVKPPGQDMVVERLKSRYGLAGSCPVEVRGAEAAACSAGRLRAGGRAGGSGLPSSGRLARPRPSVGETAETGGAWLWSCWRGPECSRRRRQCSSFRKASCSQVIANLEESCGSVHSCSPLLNAPLTRAVLPGLLRDPLWGSLLNVSLWEAG